MHTVRLTQPLEARLRLGHPWIYADAISLHPRQDAKTGDIVDVVNAQNEWVGRGVLDLDSPLRVRLWTTQQHVEVNDALLATRIKLAKKRRPFPDGSTTGFRLLNGEGDGIPGLVCDVYGTVAVLRPDGVAAERWLEPARETIAKLLPIEHWVIRRASIYSDDRDRPQAQWWGDAPESGSRVPFLEHGVQLYCDVLHGQKTGFFLDQRANRQRMAQLSTGRRLLNLFGYTGGFSIMAAWAGAAQTTTVDLAAPAIEMAQYHFEINGLPTSGMHEFVTSDVFDYLERFGPYSAPFEVAICDPPSFAHKRRDVDRASQAYERLFAKLMEVMPSNATLALCSCSSHIDRQAFLNIVAQAALTAGRTFVVTGIYGADVDHPILPGFVEADYLQCVVGTLMDD